MTPPHEAAVDTPTPEKRCACGSLLARIGPEGVELKCRRCRRLVVIPWESGRRWHGLDLSWSASTEPRRAGRSGRDRA